MDRATYQRMMARASAAYSLKSAFNRDNNNASRMRATWAEQQANIRRPAPPPSVDEPEGGLDESAFPSLMVITWFTLPSYVTFC